MNATAIFWPMIVQVVLTAVAYILMSTRRVAAVKAGEARASDFKVPKDSEKSATAARNVVLQFELPVLFYVVCLASYQVGAVDAVMVTLAWLFALARIAHAWVHLTSNTVLLRRRVFIAGLFIVLTMWLWFAVQLLLG